MLVFAAPDSVHISDITVGSLVRRAPGTVGIGITGVDMVGMNGGSTIERVTVFDHPNLVYALNCVGFQVRDCYLVNSTEAGLVIYNPEAPDTGDNDISGTVFDTTHAQSAAIKWHMGGGLRITHNKILAHRYGFLMEMTDEGDTSDLIFANNSVEAQAESCMLYRRLGQRIFTNVQIQNNQMVCEGPHLIKVETPGPWLSDIMITGNILHCLPGSQQVVFSGGHSALMKDNLLKGNGVNPVVVEAGASDIVVGYNKPPT
jgi:Right handed beta helix region